MKTDKYRQDHHDAMDRDGLTTVADQAMYAAKRLGRNQARLGSNPAVAALMAANEAADSRQERQPASSA